jgi:hypothetical protein
VVSLSRVRMLLKTRSAAIGVSSLRLRYVWESDRLLYHRASPKAKLAGGRARKRTLQPESIQKGLARIGRASVIETIWALEPNRE